MNNKSKDEALEYMVECVLATIEHQSGVKSRKEREFKRQIDIAIRGVSSIASFNITPTFGRVIEVFRDFDGDVNAWVKSIDIKYL